MSKISKINQDNFWVKEQDDGYSLYIAFMDAAEIKELRNFGHVLIRRFTKPTQELKSFITNKFHTPRTICFLVKQGGPEELFVNLRFECGSKLKLSMAG